MNKLAFIFLIIGLLSSNNLFSQVNEQILNSTNKNEIVNIAFDARVGSDTFWRKELMPILFRPPGRHTKKDDIEYKLYEIRNDSIAKVIDSSQLYIFIKDSLIKFPEKNESIQSIINIYAFSVEFPNVDTVFRSLLIKLVDSTDSKPFDISILKNKYQYSIDYNKNEYKYPSTIIAIGRVRISSIAFNNNETMACIYSEINCGSECGGGSILFLKMIDGSWEIVGEKLLWVS